MLVLLGIGLLAGVITAISPCVLPVLPILLAGSASGGRRRPYAIIAGLVASFSIFTLFAAWLLDQLGLPQDTLRNVAIALLFLLAATLVVPQLGALLERPFVRLTRRRSGDLGGGFLLGASLGLVFVPCAGPVLAAVTVIAANHHVGWKAILLTVAYAVGAAVPMLLIAVGGRRAIGRVKAFRTRAPTVRAALGVVIAATALAITLNLDRPFQTALPGYASALQKRVEDTATAKRKLAELAGGRTQLATYQAAPTFKGISRWLNTPGGKPLSLGALRGKVVLVDFWTYSCINCLRTLPHLKAWYAAYRKDGFVIVGVHTPEFAFEHVASNVREAAKKLGVRYPVAIDNDYATWNAYENQYWPAEYLIDRQGRLRHMHFGEGEYGQTERLIRRLLGERGSGQLASVKDTTPTHLITPESYLGYSRLDRYAGSQLVPGASNLYRFPAGLPQNTLAYGGYWRVEAERIVAGLGARLRLHFHAQEIHLVMGGRGSVDALVNGKLRRSVRVGGISRLYTLLGFRTVRDGILELRFSPGLSAYAFTFG